MNTYLIPITDSDTMDIWIDKVFARDFNDAKNKFIEHYKENFDWLECDDWNDLCDKLSSVDIFLGDIYDLEEF